jgi:hypothetical protein
MTWEPTPRQFIVVDVNDRRPSCRASEKVAVHQLTKDDKRYIKVLMHIYSSSVLKKKTMTAKQQRQSRSPTIRNSSPEACVTEHIVDYL